VSVVAIKKPVWKVGGFESPVWSSQRLNNWHLLLPWLAFTI